MTLPGNTTFRAAPRNLVAPILVAFLLAVGVDAVIRATQPAVSLLVALVINRVISQAHLDATPLPTGILWGDSVNLVLTAIVAVWLGVVLGVSLTSNTGHASSREDIAK
jgi:hypothetical protein